jgi:hypothetical protein
MFQVRFSGRASVKPSQVEALFVSAQVIPVGGWAPVDACAIPVGGW